MTSSIYLGGDGYWHGRVTVGVKDNGKPDRRHVMAKTEAEVTTKVRKLERARESGRVTQTSRSWTVEKWLTHWLDTIAKPTVRAPAFLEKPRSVATVLAFALAPELQQGEVLGLQWKDLDLQFAGRQSGLQCGKGHSPDHS
jgi:hypothetical protein